MEIYCIDISKINYEYYIDFLFNFVDENKKRKALRYVHKEDRIRTLIADVMVRSYLCKKYNYKNDVICYKYNEFNKPYLNNKENINFNVSHSGKYVVAAFDDEEVGVDVEKINRDMEYMKIAESFFTEGEVKRIKNLNEEERAEEFFNLWTLKESYVKFKGRGLSISLNFFDIVKDKDNVYYLENEKDIYFNTFNIDEEYKLSCCSLKKEVLLKKISFDELINLMKKYCN